MYFTTTEQQEQWRAKVREFAETEIKPISTALDNGEVATDEVVQGMVDLGLMGCTIPKEYGGSEMDTVQYIIAGEEIARVNAGIAVILGAHAGLACFPIVLAGSEELKHKYLPGLANGELLGAYGLTESDAGSDAGGIQTEAVLDGDDYILNGSKIFISNAPDADIYLVFARTSVEGGTRGISAFVVEKGWEGFTFGEHYAKMGIRSSSTAELLFNNVRVPKENLIGGEGIGFMLAMQTLDSGRIGAGAQALGIAQGAYDSALEYAKEREQFGQPIAFNQAIYHRFADMATELRAMRMMAYSAGEMKDAGEVFSKEAAMAKMYNSDMALKIVNDALQIYGGSGYIEGIDVERFYRDAKITTIYEGTNEIQREVIANHIVGRIPRGGVRKTKPTSATGERKKEIWSDGNYQENVDELVEALKKDGYDFSVGIAIDTPIPEAERVVSAGRGIGSEENLAVVEDLATQAGAAIGSSRPIAEELKWLPLERYVGLTGQKFRGNLYIAVGISGAGQHLKGIKDAGTIVAINSNANAPIFKNADYGIVGEFEEVVPLLAAALDTGEPKGEAPPMVKMKRVRPKKVAPNYTFYVCNGCGHEYDKAEGDDEADVAPGTDFDNLPDGWTCPICGEEKDMYIPV